MHGCNYGLEITVLAIAQKQYQRAYLRNDRE